MRNSTRNMTLGMALLGTVPAAVAQESEGEIVVVTASRTEQSIASAPAAVTVLTDLDIARTPADVAAQGGIEEQCCDRGCSLVHIGYEKAGLPVYNLMPDAPDVAADDGPALPHGL